MNVSKAPEGSLCRMCGTIAVVSHDILWQSASTQSATRRVNDCAACYGGPNADFIFKKLKRASEVGTSEEYRNALSCAIKDLQSLSVEIESQRYGVRIENGAQK